jgi:hypothetical protein
MEFDLPRAPIGLEEPRYHSLRTWRLAVVVGAGAGSRIWRARGGDLRSVGWNALI